MTAITMRENPYVGLKPFQQADSLYFFGRLEQTIELLDQLHETRFLAVVGSSGCGKSSLIRAGLIPHVLGGFLVEERDTWLVAKMRPGGGPLRAFAQALVSSRPVVGGEGTTGTDEDGGPSPGSATSTDIDRQIDDLVRRIEDDHVDGVLDYLHEFLGDRANLMILVDQFEEIFAFRDTDADDDGRLTAEEREDRGRRREEASDFVNLVLQLSERTGEPIYVVLAMRTDFLGDCDLFYGLPEAMNQGRYLVPRLTRPQLKHAIEGPAQLMGKEIAPRLSERLLNELGDRQDRLPVLQHALLRTWDEWSRTPDKSPLEEDEPPVGGGRPGHEIDLDHYRLAGELKDALSNDADAALRDVEAEGIPENVVESIFKLLTDTDESHRQIRHPAKKGDLCSVAGVSPDVVQKVIDCFTDKDRSFLYEHPDGELVDISHESLIRQWETLRTWVTEESESRDQYLDLVDRAHRKLEDKGELLAGMDLDVKVSWRDSRHPTVVWAKRYSREGDFGVTEKFLADGELERVAQEKRAADRRSTFRAAFLAVGALALVSLLLWRQAAASESRAESAQVSAEAAQDSAVDARLLAEAAQDSAVDARLLAEAAQNLADRSAQTARGLRLASESLRLADAAANHLAWDPEIAFRLAQAAVYASDSFFASTTGAPGRERPDPVEDSTNTAWMVLRQAYERSRVTVLTPLTATDPTGIRASIPGLDTLEIRGDSVRRRGGDLTATIVNDGEAIEVRFNNEFVSRFSGPLARVTQVSFNRDGRLLASAHEDGVARLWDPFSGVVVRELTGHSESVNWVAFDSVHRRFATASDDGAINVWSLEIASVPPIVLRGHRAPVLGVAFSDDGRSLLSASAACGPERAVGEEGAPPANLDSDWCALGAGNWRRREWSVEDSVSDRPPVEEATLLSTNTRGFRWLTPAECRVFEITRETRYYSRVCR